MRNGLSKLPGKAALSKEASNRLQIILLALGFSLLNPHAIIDSLVIIGGGSTQFPEHQTLFLMGVITSSLLWFISLTVTTYYFANTLARTTVWQRVELSGGLLMLFSAYQTGWQSVLIPAVILVMPFCFGNKVIYL